MDATRQEDVDATSNPNSFWARYHCGTHLVLRLQSPSEIEVNLTLLGPVRVHHHDPQHHARADRADRERYLRNVRPHRRRSSHRRHQHGHFHTDNLGSIVGIVGIVSSTGVKTASYAHDRTSRTFLDKLIL